MRFCQPQLFVAVALLCAGCGTPGAPQPPSLRLPKPVGDLEAIRKGDDVYLRWTLPTKTTDNAGIRPNELGPTRICRGYVTSEPNTCRDVAADINPKPGADGRATAVDHIANYVGGNRDFLSYTVAVNNDDGRNGGPSNAVLVFVAPSLAAPPALDAKLAPKQIMLTWEAHELPVSSNLKTDYLYRIKRRIHDPAQERVTETVLAELPAAPGRMSYSDTAFTWEKTYEYRVAGVTRVIASDGKVLAEFEGKDSPAAIVVAHDIFPPAVPAGLQAVYSSLESRRFIDLTWSPEIEAGVAGYNVYRSDGPSDGHSAVAKINDAPITAPAFRDDKVTAGKVYTYTVTAIDTRGNESAKSEPASEKVPE
jgi:hypothetical protein